MATVDSPTGGTTVVLYASFLPQIVDKQKKHAEKTYSIMKTQTTCKLLDVK